MKPYSLLFSLAKRYVRSILLTILTMLGLVGAQLIIPWLIRTLISTLSSSSALAETTLDTITRLTAIALLVFIARGFMQFVRSFQAHIAGWGGTVKTHVCLVTVSNLTIAGKSTQKGEFHP